MLVLFESVLAVVAISARCYANKATMYFQQIYTIEGMDTQALISYKRKNHQRAVTLLLLIRRIAWLMNLYYTLWIYYRYLEDI